MTQNEVKRSPNITEKGPKEAQKSKSGQKNEVTRSPNSTEKGPKEAQEPKRGQKMTPEFLFYPGGITFYLCFFRL